MSKRYLGGASGGNFEGPVTDAVGFAAHLLVETRVGIVVDQDVNDLAVSHYRINYWIWERGDKGNQDVHEVSLRDAIRVEITPCRDRLKRESEGDV